MGKETRKRLGLGWKKGTIKGDAYEIYYNEFKDEIDSELGLKKEVPVQVNVQSTKSTGKK